MNINSIKNKFKALIQNVAKWEVGLLMISKTKIDDRFPKSQFLIKGLSYPFHIDRSIRGGGILLYVREDIPAILLSIELIPSKCFFVNLNLRR